MIVTTESNFSKVNHCDASPPRDTNKENYCQFPCTRKLVHLLLLKEASQIVSSFSTSSGNFSLLPVIQDSGKLRFRHQHSLRLRNQLETQKNQSVSNVFFDRDDNFLPPRLSLWLLCHRSPALAVTLNVLTIITNPQNPALNSPSQSKSTVASSVFQKNFVFFFFPSLNPFNPLVQAISSTNISCNQGLAHVVIFPLINQSILSVECFFFFLPLTVIRELQCYLRITSNLNQSRNVNQICQILL